MIALYILGGILLIILLVLFLPVSVHIKFVEDFFVKIKFAGIKVFRIEPSKDETEKTDTGDTVSDKKAENTAVKESKRIFLKLKEKYGFSGAVKTVLGFIGDVLAHIKSLLRHIKIKRVEFSLTVAAEDAAQTAIEYGSVCGVAYPVFAMLESCAEIGFKNINIRSDFNSGKPEFAFSAVVKMQIFFLLLTAYRVYSEYKKFISKENCNE